ncbi:hypothetical protein IBX65_03690 [Candidatus Aerophobetes bacterium]|nr:hypothetical protein [Candidatus Aerophobetes bacterium]
MGNMSDSMQKVADDIRSSADERGRFLRELSSKTHSMIKELHNTREDEVKALKERLFSQEKARVEATRKFMDEVGVKVSEMRSDTNNLIKRYGLERRDDAKKLQNQLSSGEKKRKEDMKKVLDEIALDTRKRKEDVKKVLDEIASELSQAHRVWLEVCRKVAPEVPVVEEEVEEAAPAIYEEKILNIVSRHPDGIKLVDIGDELGVEWRALIGIIKSLVDKGTIEKIDNMYYPKKEG